MRRAAVASGSLEMGHKGASRDAAEKTKNCEGVGLEI